MGYSRSSASDWTGYLNTTVRTKATVDAVYTSRTMVNQLDPKNTKREARDSDISPKSTPIIVGLDVTGSMGYLANEIARTGLEKMAVEIYDRKPVTDPQIMCMGIGDAFTDNYPLQVTQFESDISLVDQLTKIYLEGRGGGNGSEGYILAWYYAAFHTEIDCFNKRGEKGFIFTVGDDGPTPYITKEQIKEICGEDPEFDKMTAEQLYNIVSEKYIVYHIMVEKGSSHRESDIKKWQDLLGERVILLKDHTKLGEVVTSVLQAFAGVDKDTIIKSWDGSTAMVVQEAIKGVLANKEDSLHTF